MADAHYVIGFVAGISGRNISPERRRPPWPTLNVFSRARDFLVEGEEVSAEREFMTENQKTIWHKRRRESARALPDRNLLRSGGAAETNLAVLRWLKERFQVDHERAAAMLLRGGIHQRKRASTSPEDAGSPAEATTAP